MLKIVSLAVRLSVAVFEEELCWKILLMKRARLSSRKEKL